MGVRRGREERKGEMEGGGREEGRVTAKRGERRRGGGDGMKGGAGGMAQELRALAALPEDQGSILSTYIVAHSY